MPQIKISNRQARWLWLYSQGLSDAPTGRSDYTAIATLIDTLGLLQQDPIRVVARAHDHILWTRLNQYRPKHLETLMHKHRGVFEHFSHDACLLPMHFLPYWRRQFARRSERYERPDWAKGLLPKKEQAKLLEQIANNGPQASKDFKAQQQARPASGEIWSKPAHKQTLDYLWLKGELAVSHRKKFVKYYDIASKVYPPSLLAKQINDEEQVNWLCANALSRLGFAGTGDIMRFWEACSLPETKSWCDDNQNRLIKLSIEGETGESTEAYCLTEFESLIAHPPEPTKRLRILNPFDPAIRDRRRIERLFGFEYRIEMYTPADKRQYGYYVYPLLEFDQIIGRIEVAHHRQSNELRVNKLWLEPSIKFGKGRQQLLESELSRMQKFCGASCTVFADRYVS